MKKELVENGRLLEAALKYLKGGFNVIPVGKDKKPLISWEPYETRHATEAEARRWWGEQFPEANIGIVTGQTSGIDVVDCDTPEAEAEFIRLIGGADGIPRVRTPRGGAHFYFRHEPGMRNRTCFLPETDLRAQGGQVVAPPSFVDCIKDNYGPVKGPYVWEIGSVDAERPEMPPVLVNLLSKNGKGYHPPEGPPLTQGHRDNDVFHMALSLLNDNIPPDEVLGAVLMAAKGCTPPFPEEEARAKFKSALAHYLRRQARAGANSQPLIVETTDPNNFLKTGTELQALDIHVEWAIERLLPARSLTLLYGRSGIGKTWLALMMARCISLGVPLFDLATIRRPVVYVDYENPLSVLVDRVRNLNIRDVQFWHLSAETPPPKLDSPDWTLFKRLPQGSVLVFDTARACHNMEENSSEAPALVMGRLKELRELDHEVILLHHTSKADDQNAKGSSGWYDLADHTLSFCRVKRGTLEEVDDGGGFDSGALLSLGVGKKTRFEPLPRLYLTLDPDVGGLVLAASPDALAIDALAEYIAGPGFGKNQSEIIEWAKENGVGPQRRQDFITLLNRGERHRWQSHREGGRSRIYEPSS